jgi:hypothetical protein
MSKVQLQGNASGTGIFTIASPNSNTDRTLTLPDSTGTLLTSAAQSIPKSALPTGSVLQVIQNTSTTTYNITAGGTPPYTQFTNFNVTITPLFSSSKILLFATIPWTGFANLTGTTVAQIDSIWYRNTTQLNGGSAMASHYGNNNTYIQNTVMWLDSPSTTSATTYYIYGKGADASGGEYSWNRGGRTVTLIAMEIAG